MMVRIRSFLFSLGVVVLTISVPATCARCQDSQGELETSYLAHLAAASAALRLNESTEARRWLDEIPSSARAWEWRFLDAKVDSSIHQLSTDPWTPVRLDLSVDGDRLAVACTDGFVRVYRTQSLELISEWRVSEQAVYAARFHPKGQLLAACSRDGQISVWDISTKKQLWIRKNGGEGLADLVFRPDGHQLLFCSWYRGDRSVLGIVSTWDAMTGEQTWKSEFGVKPIVSARYSPDGKYFAVGTWDAIVGLWKTESPSEPRIFDFADRAQYSAIDDIAFSPDSKKLAAATKNGTPRIWTIEESAVAVDMIGHSNAVYSIAFSADGNSLLTGGSDGVVAVWDVARRVQSHRFFGHTNRIVSISVDSNRHRAVSACADKTLRVWDLNAANGFESKDAGKYVYGMVVADDGKSLVTGGQSDTTISVWDANSKKTIRHFAGTTSTVNYLDGDRRNWIVGGNWNGDVCIWDTTTGEIVVRMGSKELGGMQQCALSGDRKWVASATNKKQVVVWDAKTGDVAKTIPMPNGCWGIDFSPDSQSLVVGDGKGSVHWIAVANWETVWTCNASNSEIKAIRIAPSGDWLAAGTESGLLCIVDVQQRRVRHQVQGHSERIWTLDISPDGKRIVTGSSDLRVKTWEPRSGLLILTIADFSDPIYNVRFSLDGQSLFVNSLGSKIVKLTTN